MGKRKEEGEYKTTPEQRSRQLEYYHRKRLDPEWNRRRLDKLRAKYAQNMLDPDFVVKRREKMLQDRYIYKYGITLDRKKEMYEEQDKMCEICTKPLPTISSAHLDHNHETGQIRGLLCSKCNTGLHWIENKQYYEKAKEYLKNYETIGTREP